METLNEIRAARLIAILSNKMEQHHNNLLTLKDKAEHFEIQACKAKKLYAVIINEALIDSTRLFNLADKYFNHSGRVPSEVDGHKIYHLSDLSYLMKWFEC